MTEHRLVPGETLKAICRELEYLTDLLWTEGLDDWHSEGAKAQLMEIKTLLSAPDAREGHTVEVFPADMGRLRQWISHPNGALTMGRCTLEAVGHGGIFIRTRPYRGDDQEVGGDA